MKKIFGIIIFISIANVPSLLGQQKINFRSQNYVGLLEGDIGSSWQIQTINGFQTGTWFAGVGTGLDFYRYRTVPLFLSLNKSIKSADNSFYFLSDGGLNFAWVDKEPRSRFNDYISDKFIPSFYWNGGIGYKAMIGKKEDAVLINLAYSYKRLKEEKEAGVTCITPPCPSQFEEYNYRLKRISIRLGWQF